MTPMRVGKKRKPIRSCFFLHTFGVQEGFRLGLGGLTMRTLIPKGPSPKHSENKGL